MIHVSFSGRKKKVFIWRGMKQITSLDIEEFGEMLVSSKKLMEQMNPAIEAKHIRKRARRVIMIFIWQKIRKFLTFWIKEKKEI